MSRERNVCVVRRFAGRFHSTLGDTAEQLQMCVNVGVCVHPGVDQRAGPLAALMVQRRIERGQILVFGHEIEVGFVVARIRVRLSSASITRMPALAPSLAFGFNCRSRPSDGRRRSTGWLSQACHFYARRLISNLRTTQLSIGFEIAWFVIILVQSKSADAQLRTALVAASTVSL